METTKDVYMLLQQAFESMLRMNAVYLIRCSISNEENLLFIFIKFQNVFGNARFRAFELI